jgi:hypothetical protein
MWGISPKYLCRFHLLGEHNEMHKAIGCIKKKKSIRGYLEKRFLNPKLIKTRHDELVIEMLNRNYNHLSPIDFDCSHLENIEIDLEYNKLDLSNRCQVCAKNIKEIAG